MIAEADVVCRQSIPVLDIQYRSCGLQDIGDVASPLSLSSPTFDPILGSESVTFQDLKSVDIMPDLMLQSALLQFVPIIRSGSFADIGLRDYMEDEHVRIDDLSEQLGSIDRLPKPSAFYGVFDGHGGPDAAAYVRENVIRLFFEDVEFPRASKVDDIFQKEVACSLREAFLLADQALASDRSISSKSGTTALTALIFGSLLMVANAGDCRAVLCRKGRAINMSQDHRPDNAAEKRRVEELGGQIDDGYLNGDLSVSRALGDWYMKSPQGTSPLIADPEFQQVFLTEDDEFLIIGCDGIWDVMSSQHAVSLVRRGLRRHDDPEQCARDLAAEAMLLKASDNLTVIVVCFSTMDRREPSPARRRKCFSLSQEALIRLKKSLLDGNSSC